MADEEDEGLDDKNNNGADADNNTMADEEGSGYVAFRGRQARGVLYRINAMSDALIERMETYVHKGAMAKDMKYARAVYGLVNTSGRKDFELYWESPWNEEHVQDALRSESWRRSSAPSPCAATSAQAACR